MRVHAWTAAAMILAATCAVAQQTKPEISAEGGPPDDRGSARVLYWNDTANTAAGEFAFNYGRPVWKKDYEDPAKFNKMTEGQVWRMGSNFWTELQTEMPLEIGGKGVPVGAYFLGLRRSADGSEWSMVFIDPAKALASGRDAFEIQKAPIEFEAPMTIAKADGIADKLTLTLSYPPKDMYNVTLLVHWGNLALTAPIKVTHAD